MDTIKVQNAAWSAFNNDSNHYPGDPVDFEPVNPQLFDQGSIQHHQRERLRQVPHSRTPGNVGEFPDSAAVVQQLSALSEDMLNSGASGQENSLPFFNSVDGQSALTPDFLDGISFQQDMTGTYLHLSNYLGEMPSGSYMPG
jgi:hypothetical protein